MKKILFVLHSSGEQNAATHSAAYENRKNRGKCVGLSEQFFFFFNRVKNPISYFKLDGFRKLEVESCHPTRISGTWVGNRQNDALRKKPRKTQKIEFFRFLHKNRVKICIFGKKGYSSKNKPDFFNVNSMEIDRKLLPEKFV